MLIVSYHNHILFTSCTKENFSTMVPRGMSIAFLGMIHVSAVLCFDFHMIREIEGPLRTLCKWNLF